MKKPEPNFSIQELDRIVEKLIKAKGIKPENWSQKDIYLLKKLYGKISTSDISSLLNRSQNSIQLKALRMGIKFWSE